MNDLFTTPMIATLNSLPDIGQPDEFARSQAEHRVQESLMGILSELNHRESFGILVRFDNSHVEIGILIETSSSRAEWLRSRADSRIRTLTTVTSWSALPMSFFENFQEVMPVKRRLGDPLNIPVSWPELTPHWPAVLNDLASGIGQLTILMSISACDLAQGALFAARRRENRVLAKTGTDTTESAAMRTTNQRRGFVVHCLVAGDTDRKLQFTRLLGSVGQERSFSLASVRSFPATISQQVNAVVSGQIVDQKQAVSLVPLPTLDSTIQLPFGRRPLSLGQYSATHSGLSLVLGKTDAIANYSMPIDDMAQHMLVTGLQGYGKSTTVQTMLKQLWDDFNTSFLVIDPIKDDYFGMKLKRPLRSHAKSPRIIEIGASGNEFNPLAVPNGVEAEAYAGILSDLYDGVTRLSDTYPLGMSVMRRSFHNVYLDWDSSVEGQGWPTMAHLYAQVQRDIAITGRGDTLNNLRASLPTRLQTIMSGVGGDSMSGGPRSGLDWERILQEPTIISLRKVESHEAREACFAFILAGLMAYRRSHGLKDSTTAIQHVAVLEEAHTVLKSEGNARSIAEALATQRAMGQSYVLISQSPTQLPDVVFELFATRVSHRLNAGTGADKVASSLGLTNTNELRSLGKGEVLIVNANGYPTPTRVTVLQASEQSTNLEFSTAVAAVDPPERIWCTECPAPCRGRQWLSAVPQALEYVLSSEVALNASMKDQSTTMAAHLISEMKQLNGGIPGASMDIEAGLYCGVARGLTMLYSNDPLAVRKSMVEARYLANQVTSGRLARKQGDEPKNAS